MLALGRTHTQMESLIFGKLLLADSRHTHQIVNRGKSTVLCPLIDNRLGHGGTDARERLQLCRACRIDIY